MWFLIQMLLGFCLCYFQLSGMCQDLRFCLSMWSVALLIWLSFFNSQLYLNNNKNNSTLYLVLSSKSKLTFLLLLSILVLRYFPSFMPLFKLGENFPSRFFILLIYSLSISTVLLYVLFPSLFDCLHWLFLLHICNILSCLLKIFILFISNSCFIWAINSAFSDKIPQYLFFF